MSEDQALEVAIEVGAEEVIEGLNEDGLESFQVFSVKDFFCGLSLMQLRRLG